MYISSACYCFVAGSCRLSSIAAVEAAAFATENSAFSDNEGLAFDVTKNLSIAGQLQLFLAGDVTGNLTGNSCVLRINGSTDVTGFTDKQVVVNS